MRKMRIDPETSEMIKIGVLDCLIEIAKIVLVFALGATFALSLVSDVEAGK